MLKVRKSLLVLFYASVIALGVSIGVAWATTTVGDKIGFTAPNPGADTDTWGTVLNSMFTQWDEFFYASREDRNMTISGGGKISYDNSTGNVTFDASFVFRNHITAFVNNVTTAASPVTLNASNKVAYVQLSRKPSGDNSITSATVVAAGSLPNTVTDADAGTIVLFQRTADGTLWMPRFQKEIMSGDHWQIGTAQTWYERIASRAKPAYRSNNSDTSQLYVPASTANPAVVYIDGKLYANTSDETLDLDTAGRNGLDTGAKAANTDYYLYAIPSASGRTFDVVCSATGPGTGPTGFSSWSFLGGFATQSGGATLAQFWASGGLYLADNEIETESHTGSTSINAETYESLPTTAKLAYGELGIDGATANTTGRAMGTNTASNNAIIVVQGGANNQALTSGFVPMFTDQTIYIQTDTSGNTVEFLLLGWKEDPMEYK